jgi:hypothetical protein
MGLPVPEVLVREPVLLEVVARDERMQPHDGLGAFHAPPCLSDVHAVLDEVAAGPLEDPGGDGQAFCEVEILAEVGSQGREVPCDGPQPFLVVSLEAPLGGEMADLSADLLGFSGEDHAQP